VVAVFDGRGAGLDLDGLPAITRRAVGAGAAWYLATDLDAPGRTALLTAIMAASGVTQVLPGLRDGIEAARRGPFLFLLNHGDTAVVVEGVQGTDLLTGERVDGRLVLAARGSAVVDGGDWVGSLVPAHGPSGR
jgi:beta-galactosidase